jgi:hypothetical protein
MNHRSPRSLRESCPISSQPLLVLPNKLLDTTRSSAIQSSRVRKKSLDTTRSSAIQSHRSLLHSQHDASQDHSDTSVERVPELDVAKPQVPSTLIQYTIKIALIVF